MKNLFDEAMSGIGEKVALQEIRKVLRGKLPVKQKLDAIVDIVYTYTDYKERQQLEAERRAIQAEEEDARKQRVDELFDGLKEDMDKLTIRKGEQDES